jgi:hypothetical protein
MLLLDLCATVQSLSIISGYTAGLLHQCFQHGTHLHVLCGGTSGLYQSWYDRRLLADVIELVPRVQYVTDVRRSR